MNRRKWQEAFGDVPEDFRQQLHRTLNNLEGGNMKKFKLTTVLIAAVISMALITGVTLAATRLNILRRMNQFANPIIPLQGAEELEAADMGSTENNHAALKVEEALYDGQGMMLQLRLTPKDPARDALFNEMLQTDSLDDYIVEERPVEAYPEDGPAGCQLDSARVEAETYEQDGRRYYKDQFYYEILGRRDGKRMIDYEFRFEVNGGALNDLIPVASWDAEEQSDGSVVVWVEANAEQPLDAQIIHVKVSGETRVDGEDAVPLGDVDFNLAADKDERRVRLEPVGDGKGERCQVLGGKVLFTKICGYMTLDYLYEPVEGEVMGAVIDVTRADGQPVATGGGWEDYPGSVSGMQLCRVHWKIQSSDELPETLFFEVRASGKAASDPPLGRVECKVIEE